MTTWKARRVGDRILCGRPAPSRGYCSGLIAMVERFAMVERSEFALPFGLKEEPRGSHVWIPRARTQDRAGRPGHHQTWRIFGRWYDRGASWDTTAADPPFWRACPVCNVLAEVTADLLE